MTLSKILLFANANNDYYFVVLDIRINKEEYQMTEEFYKNATFVLAGLILSLVISVLIRLV